MAYLKSLECLCVVGGSGSLNANATVIKAKISGNVSYSSSIESSGILHTPYERCTLFAPLFNVQDLSPAIDPNTRYRVFVNTKDFHFAPEVNDTFIVECGGTSYQYNISAVTLS